MAEDGPADPLEGIRDVFGAYKMLPPLGTKYQYLDVVVNQLDKAFGDEPEPLGVNESQTLKTVCTVFMVYKKLNKWDPETASEILVEQLERVFALNEKEPVNTDKEPGRVEELDVSQCITPETSQTVHQTAVTPFDLTSESLTFPAAHKGPSSCSLPSTSADQSTVAGSSSTIPENDDLSQDEVNDVQIQGHSRHKTSTVANHALEKSGVISVNTRPAASTTKSRVPKRRNKHPKHSNGREKRRPRVACPYCKKTMRADHLTRHIRIHTGERPFSCQHCQAKYMRQDSLKSHLEARERRFPCRFQPCCHSFALAHARTRHELSHHDDTFSTQQQETLANSVFSLIDENVKDPDLPALEIEGRDLKCYTLPPKKPRKRKSRPVKCEMCNVHSSV